MTDLPASASGHEELDRAVDTAVPLIAWLERQASGRPQAPALWMGDGWCTWSELAQTVRQLAESHAPRWLRSMFVDRAPRIVTTFPNDHRAVVGALVLQTLGCVEVPLGGDVPTERLRECSQRCAADAIWSSQTLLGETSVHVDRHSAIAAQAASAGKVAGQAVAPQDPDSEGLILWTGGTTGVPRGVRLSHRALRTNAQGKLIAAPQTAQDCRLTVLPLHHAYARTCDLGTWLLSGCRLAVGLGWQGLRSLAPQVRPTLLNAVPSLVRRLLHHEEKPTGNNLRRTLHTIGLDQLRMLGCGGAPLGAAEYDLLTSAGLCVIHGYGLTEAGPVVCSASPETARPGCVGKPIAGTEIRLDDQGQLWVRGPGIMLGYVDESPPERQTLIEGWLRTGDLATIQADGVVEILGRVDDTLVLANGHKLQPLVVEQVVERIRGVRHAIAGAPRGELVMVVDGAPDAMGEALWQQAVRASIRDLPRWQQPRRWFFLPQPLAASLLTLKGQPRRRAVLARYALEPAR